MEDKMHSADNIEKDFVPTELIKNSVYCPSKRHPGEPILKLHVVLILCLTFTVCVLVTFFVTRAIFHQNPSECLVPACPEYWIGFQRKCFYFSDDTKNWTFSQRFCNSQGADLVQVETLQELDFLLRYKGPYDHWIGLSREEGQLWKWINGTEWNSSFPIKGGGECAYLNDKGASSARHYSERKWICSKPDMYIQMRRQSPK
ncbi:C-type lectin domain family 2 member D [Camelus dromedarius]|uniref:C-type lectin domain family 2 member D n=1 Tax=Camelus dromedarius TaxID=9838 RepID=A0A5N4C6X0_CAMDR|nr:C-type lectin domain family 2 member D [Camelus dromedarius]KAB1254600.1 C-type lectin domain family 2 member D [Camelus dromedarius]